MTSPQTPPLEPNTNQPHGNQTNWGQPAAPGWGSWSPQPAQSNQLTPPVVPFRALTLGDLFEGTFAAIRSNPKVMFTISLTVLVGVGVIAAIVNVFALEALDRWDFLSQIFENGDSEEFLSEFEASYQISFGLPFAQLGLSLFQGAATLFVTGMLVLAVTNAVVSNNLSLSNTWNQLRPRFVRLILTAILTGLIFTGFAVVVIAIFTGAVALMVSSESLRGAIVALTIVLGIAVIPFAIWLSVRLSFSTMVVVVEDISPTNAIARSWALTRNSVFRLFVRYLLLSILMGTIMSLLGGVIYVIAGLATAVAPLWVGTAVTTLLLAVLAGFAQPVSSAFTSLMYVDERMRKENLAPTLQAALAENLLKGENA